MNILVTRHNKLYLLVCFLLYIFFFKNVLADPLRQQEKDIPNVIIIILSGVRNIDSIADPSHQYIPHLWNDMMKEGMLYRDVICLDQEFHMPVANAINTNQGFPLLYKIKTPTIFQYVRKKYGWPANKFWMIGLWKMVDCYYALDGYKEDTYPSYISLDLRLAKELEAEFSQQELLAWQLFRKGQNEFAGFNFDTWDTIQEMIYQLFQTIVKTFHPKLVHYIIGGPETAHYDSFSRYVLSLKRNDEMIYEIWKMINTDPLYKGNTYLIVGPDHERDVYFKFHDENAHDNPSHVWLYVFGPGVKKGAIVNRTIRHVDIFPTVARIMELEIPPGEGRILEELFSGDS